MGLFFIAGFAQTPQDWSGLEKPLNFYLANDLGRNGYYDQKPIAEMMGKMAENIDIEFVVAAGDVHHFEGVRSVNDPLWLTNYELIYSHPDLMLPWYPILGNHEYRGNTQAVIDYSNVSARWRMPARYYTRVEENDDITIRLVMVDTAPLLDKYRKDTDKYPDACKQDIDKQLAWIDSVLTASKEDWVLVVGHHPIYADTDKNDSERTDLQKRLDSILRKHKNVDMYLCGHIHNFQHIRKPELFFLFQIRQFLPRCQQKFAIVYKSQQHIFQLRQTKIALNGSSAVPGRFSYRISCVPVPFASLML